ncbi:ATPase family AAA domain-containing protein 2-like isoform X1 [Anguilla anguilla]|uniref:ATPase family AAA domain-containing protein 2-like isoform X1 n=1 Tax=Anguilla anguilla TaxID=7936 RepID=UPI0015ADA195|nr:ATPase family AAA domain-containing protein 2-like isoform X1 [Anguilla anguilla]XP_035285772.1 ATPase family AAA domain-containing protein 2-like isoform X1 [Anguilla anguilla]
MVMLRSSSSADTGTEKKPSELDTTSEFLSLQPSPRKSARRNQGDCSSCADTPTNGYLTVKEEETLTGRTLRTRSQKTKNGVSFADANGQTAESPQEDDNGGKRFTRKSPRLQASEEEQAGQVDGTPTSRSPRCKAGGAEANDTVRRSSRTTRYKQSVLYDRLITNTAEAVLQKMDDMQKRRRRLRSRDTEDVKLVMYTGTKRKRKADETDEEAPDNHEEGNEGYTEDEGDEEEEEEEEEDEDEEDDDDAEDNQKRYEVRQRKAVVRYQAPLEEPRKQTMFFNRHPSSRRRRYSFSSTAPRSPYNSRRNSRNGSIDGRRHALHSSDTTSSSSSSDDEERFERRRSKNRNRPINRCLPLNLRKEDLLGIHKDRMKIGASLADVDPMQIDQSVRFDSIGGLTSHIAALKEMVVFPLLYPEVFERFKIQPPRGCLFYGPPGTGKTLVARALANECSQEDKKVAFFMRKGADCLSKWVGESERQLRLLFDQAYQMRPSIIFFDEIDGLAPVRSSRQDQIHSSIVSTLLALMDGLDARGEVVVIGATNRLDSIDPALRRPGRFDREFLFGLPDREARRDILKIHTRQWNPQLSDAFLEELAEHCVGYCGADIKAVCAEAALCALRRRYPQIYASSQKLQLDVSSISMESRDFLAAMRKTVPAAHRAVSSPAKALTPVVQPLLGGALASLLGTLRKLFPHAERGLRGPRQTDLTASILEDDLMYSEDEGPSVFANGPLHKQATPKGSFLRSDRSALHQPTSHRPRLLLTGRQGSGQSSHLAPALLHALERFSVYTLDMAVLYGASAASPEEACAQLFREAKRTAPSILYVPHIQLWWDTVGSALRATFLSLLQDVPPFSPILLLATCSQPHHSLFQEVQDLFRDEYGEVYEVQLPTQQERTRFFEDLILNQAAKAPASKKKAVLQAMEVLPVAPPPAPRQMTGAELQRLEEQEEDTLRELRLFLRSVADRLTLDKRFKAFTKPVDVQEVPDYLTVIKQPMDLSTVLSNIDLHKYVTVKEFTQDVDLIWQNALEYNPDIDPSDRLIRHRACSLKDTVHAIIKDELDEEFEKICEQIKESRSNRGCSTSRFAPSYYHVLPRTSGTGDPAKNCTSAAKEVTVPTATSTPRVAATQKKKRRRSRWSNGIITKKKSSSSAHASKEDEEEGEEEDEDGKLGESEEGEEEAEHALESGVEELDAGGDSSAECDLRLPKSSGAAGQEGAEDGERPTPPPAEEVRRPEHGSAEPSHTPAEPVDLGGKAPPESAGPERAEEDIITEKGVVRMTRGRRSQVQQHMDVEKAMQILNQKTPQLVVDHEKLKELLRGVVSNTEGCEVYQLEKLYALLCQSIYRHRKDYDKTALIEEMKNEIDSFI